MTCQILSYHDFVRVIFQTALVTVYFIFYFPISQATYNLSFPISNISNYMWPVNVVYRKLNFLSSWSCVLSFDFSSFLNVRPCFFASLINISWLFLVFCFIHSVVLLLFHIVTPEWCLKDAFLFRLMALSRSPNKCSAERFVVLLWVVCKRSSSVILTTEPLSKWSTSWRLTTLRIMSLSFSSVDLQDSFPSYKN